MNLPAASIITAVIAATSIATSTTFRDAEVSARVAPQRLSIPGTYRIVVCRPAECSLSDTSRAIAWGELVLAEDSLSQKVRKQFPDSFLSGAPNGCYNLRTRQNQRSLAGLEPRAVTFWQRSANKLSFTLYQSPDAAHDVSMVLQGDTLRGTGTSWGSYGETFLNDVVRAVRIGPADISRCHAPKLRVRDDAQALLQSQRIR